MNRDHSSARRQPPPSESPEPAKTDTASRVQHALRLGGLLIALVQGAVLPLLALLSPSAPPPSLPVIALAGTMMATGQAVKIAREKKS